MSELARSFERAAEEYERGRPGWPDVVADVVDLATDARVLDLAAGTGKLTRVLVRHFARVVAVEPLDRMRAVLKRVVPQAEAIAGSAEAIPVEGASFDAVFVAEAFHWFATPSAVAEIERVLKPGGALVLLWNVFVGEYVLHAQWPRETPKQSRYESGEWRKALEGSRFGDLRMEAFDHVQVVDTEGLRAYFASVSWIAMLPDEERSTLLATLPDDQEFRRQLRAEVYWTQLSA